MDNKSKNQGIPTFTPPEDGAPVFTPPKTPQHDGPVCYHHPSEPAVARCARCGKFPERIIFSLNDNDADNLVENVSVTGLRDNTVYFTDGVKDTYQMKPYIAPTAMELEHFLSSLN